MMVSFLSECRATSSLERGRLCDNNPKGEAVRELLACYHFVISFAEPLIDSFH